MLMQRRVRHLFRQIICHGPTQVPSHGGGSLTFWHSSSEGKEGKTHFGFTCPILYETQQQGEPASAPLYPLLGVRQVVMPTVPAGPTAPTVPESASLVLKNTYLTGYERAEVIHQEDISTYI